MDLSRLNAVIEEPEDCGGHAQNISIQTGNQEMAGAYGISAMSCVFGVTYRECSLVLRANEHGRPGFHSRRDVFHVADSTTTSKRRPEFIKRWKDGLLRSYHRCYLTKTIRPAPSHVAALPEQITKP